MDYPRGVEPHRKQIRITFYHKGKRYRRYLNKDPSKARNIAEAARKREDYLSRLKYGLPIDDKDDDIARHNPTVNELCATFINTHKGKDSTVDSYDQCLACYWRPYIGDKRILDLRYGDILEADAANDWSSAKTRKNAIGALRGVLKLARSLVDDFDADFAAKLPTEKVEKRDVEPFSATEESLILSNLEGDPLDYFTLAFETGCRIPGELNAVRWEDYDGQSLHVSQAISRRKLGSTKTHAARKVLLTPKAIAVLERRVRPINGGYIFTNSHGGPHLDGDVMNGHFRRALKAAGIEWRRAYNCRHTRATRDLMAGGKPAFLASQLGHTLEQFFNVYATWIRSDDDAAEMAKIIAGRSEIAPKSPPKEQEKS